VSNPAAVHLARKVKTHLTDLLGATGAGVVTAN